MTYLLIFLALTAELQGFVFHGLWSTPLTTLGGAIFLGLPGLKIPLWDLVALVTLFSQRGGKAPRVPPMLSAIKLALLGVLGMALWGFVHGGSLYQSVFQVRTFVLGLFLAMLIASVCQTRADIESLLKVVTFAALYRACVLLAFYFAVARDLPQQLPALTDHCDSALFVGGLFLLVINALERKTAKAIRWAIFGGALLCVAIALNNRRLAWLLIGVGAAFIYFVLPPSALKRRINRIGLVLAPFFLAYLAAGWGRSTGIFKPVGSISTMFGTHQDASSVMRDIENFNLVVTLKSNPVLGVGFGYEYIEAVRAYDISNIFKQYRYLPHNSLLGFIAFTGILGFSAIWQVVVVACYFHSRVYRTARDAVPRIAALWSLVAIVVIELQMWGDIGLNHIGVNVLLAVVIGLAARLPTITGAWPGTEASQPG